ncbi:MAG: ECF-type sigma factor, partial [Chthoniobacteraceae bacterium]
ASPEARAALSELCSAYYAPVIAFLRRDGRDQDSAREVAHEFFAHVLAGDVLDGAERGRGRFRSYLLGAVKHFLANRHRHDAREKRGGGVEHQVLGPGTDTSPGVDIADTAALPPEETFEREWAVAIVERAIEALRGESTNVTQFEALKSWLTPGASTHSQPETAAQLGLSEGALKVAIHRLRVRFRALVRAEIMQTLHDPADLEDEMQHLIAALA